jgi:hypothetical protein
MALSNYGSVAYFVGDGNTKAFQGPRISDADQTLVVRVDGGAPKVQGTDYQLNRDGPLPVVTFATAPALNADVRLSRVTPRGVVSKSLVMGDDRDPLDLINELLDAGLEGTVQFFVNATDLAANTAQELLAPVAGRISRMDTIVSATITTGGTIVPQVGTTNVAGWATHSHGSKKALGDIVSSAPADETVATAYIRKSARLRAVLASFATAGALNGQIAIRPFG